MHPTSQRISLSTPRRPHTKRSENSHVMITWFYQAGYSPGWLSAFFSPESGVQIPRSQFHIEQTSVSSHTVPLSGQTGKVTNHNYSDQITRFEFPAKHIVPVQRHDQPAHAHARFDYFNRNAEASHVRHETEFHERSSHHTKVISATVGSYH